MKSIKIKILRTDSFVSGLHFSCREQNFTWNRAAWKKISDGKSSSLQHNIKTLARYKSKCKPSQGLLVCNSICIKEYFWTIVEWTWRIHQIFSLFKQQLYRAFYKTFDKWILKLVLRISKVGNELGNLITQLPTKVKARKFFSKFAV